MLPLKASALMNIRCGWICRTGARLACRLPGSQNCSTPRQRSAMHVASAAMGCIGKISTRTFLLMTCWQATRTGRASISRQPHKDRILIVTNIHCRLMLPVATQYPSQNTQKILPSPPRVQSTLLGERTRSVRGGRGRGEGERARSARCCMWHMQCLFNPKPPPCCRMAAHPHPALPLRPRASRARRGRGTVICACLARVVACAGAHKGRPYNTCGIHASLSAS